MINLPLGRLKTLRGGSGKTIFELIGTSANDSERNDWREGYENRTMRTVLRHMSDRASKLTLIAVGETAESDLSVNEIYTCG